MQSLINKVISDTFPWESESTYLGQFLKIRKDREFLEKEANRMLQNSTGETFAELNKNNVLVARSFLDNIALDATSYGILNYHSRSIPYWSGDQKRLISSTIRDYTTLYTGCSRLSLYAAMQLRKYMSSPITGIVHCAGLLTAALESDFRQKGTDSWDWRCRAVTKTMSAVIDRKGFMKLSKKDMERLTWTLKKLTSVVTIPGFGDLTKELNDHAEEFEEIVEEFPEFGNEFNREIKLFNEKLNHIAFSEQVVDLISKPVHYMGLVYGAVDYSVAMGFDMPVPQMQHYRY